MQTAVDDPETALRKRIRAQLTASPDPAATGGTQYGDSGYQFGGAPIPSAEFAPVAQSTMPRSGDDGSYTPPDPPPYVPPVAPPAAPPPAAPTPIVPVPPPPAGTPAPTIGIPGGPETRPPAPTIEAPPAPAASAAPAGWDQTKWDDQGHTSTKYVVGRILAKYPPTVAGLNQAFAEIKAQFPGASFNGKDTLTGLPGTAGPVDVLMNASSGGSGWWWGDTGASGGAGGGGGATGAVTNTAGAGAGAGATANTPDWYNQIRAMLTARITAAQTPVNQDDEYIAGPLSAARDEVSRGQDQERKALAERLYATGSLNSGELTQGIQQSAERNSLGMSQLRAGLISKEYTARRDELANYLQLAMASGDAEMARSIQLQIAQLNAAIQRETLSLDKGKYEAWLSQQAALAGLNG